MTDHLEAINDNTNELSNMYSYIEELDKKISKLNERLDEAEMKILKINGQKKMESSDFKDIKLNPKEQEIFILLYEENGELLDYKKIARNLGLTEEIVRRTISGIISKGIPIVKKYFDSKIYLMLDPEFRELQIKEKVIKLE